LLEGKKNWGWGYYGREVKLSRGFFRAGGGGKEYRNIASVKKFTERDAQNRVALKRVAEDLRRGMSGLHNEGLGISHEEEGKGREERARPIWEEGKVRLLLG